MKNLNIFILLYIFAGFTLYSQGVVWKAESDTISAKTFDSLMKINMYYSFITDDNQFVLAGSVTTGNIFKPYSINHYPLIRVFNTSTGKMVKAELIGNSHEYIKKTIDTTYNFVGDSLDSASIYDEKNWIMEIDTTFDTLNLTAQWPLKTIKVGNEYWFICFNNVLGSQYVTPIPYLVKMDEEFNIIEKIDKISQKSMFKTDPLSLITTDNSFFYNENTKCFIKFGNMSDTLIIKQFDTSLNYINQIVNINIMDSIPDFYLKNSIKTTLTAEKLDNGNYVIWYYSFLIDSTVQYSYRTVLHRLYDSDLNLIMERKRIRDDRIGYMDAGILTTPMEIIKNPDTGGYFISVGSNTGILLEEYTSNGDSVRTLYFDICDVFPECQTTTQVLYKDGRFTFIGTRLEKVDDSAEYYMSDSTYHTVYLVETDEIGNVIGQYKVPPVYIGSGEAQVIFGKEPNTYYISLVHTFGNPDFESYDYRYYNYNYIVLKFENNSSVLEPNQYSDIIVAPNPISSSFTVDYNLKTSGLLSITITDLLGEQVTEEYNSFAEAGVFTKTIDIEKLLPGVYYLNILHDGKITVKKIIKV